MPKRILYFIIFCILLTLTTSCANRMTEVKTRLTYGNFSILPPEPKGWYYLGSYDNGTGGKFGAILVKQKDKPAIEKSYIVSVMLQNSDGVKAITGLNSIESEESFKKAVEKEIAISDAAQGMDRVNVKNHLFLVKKIMGTVCIYRDFKGLDKKHYNSEMTMIGYTCKHPKYHDDLIDIAVSIRSMESIPSKETENILEKIMKTLIFK
ncbi:MAG: hypothetical protein K0R98_2036 [Rickettsiaceae bacterium]|jgi:hypothetical protein|nr:hypothetical protein [Rickettsiaceae bacterium]